MAKAKPGTAIQLHPKLQKFRSAVDSRTAIKDVFVEPSFKIDSINTGSTVMNMLIGGSRLPDGSFVCPGWPRGMISEVYGRESSGKSTIALTGMGHAIAGGGVGFYVDLECAVKDHYAMKLGVDFRPPAMGGTGQALRAQPHTAEETEALVTQAALNGVDFIVIDSVAGLVSEREWKRDVSNKDEKKGVAEVPRFMANWMPKLQGIIARTGTHVMFLNQTRDKIGAMGFSEEALKSTTGGNALKFWAAVRMLLKPKRSTKAKIYNPIIKSKEDVQIATDIEIKMVKNKVDAKQGHSGLITIRYGVGIDELLTMLNVAEAYNIVSKKKSWYTFTGPTSGKEIRANGFEKFRLQLSKDKEAVQELFEVCTDRIVQGYRTIDEETLASLAEGAVTKKMDDQDYEAGEPPEVHYADVDDPDEDAPVAGAFDLEGVADEATPAEEGATDG
jgi:recombination protein RecA